MKIDKQVEKVFEEVIELLYREAYSRNSVVKWLKKKYKLENSRAYEIVNEAKVYFGKFLMETDEELLQGCIQILEENRERAKKLYNLREVRECTKEIAKLQQLYVQKIEHTMKMEQPLFGDINKEEE